MGSDAALKWAISDRFTINSKFSYIYAKDQKHDDVLIYIPPAQWENGITLSIPDVGGLKEFYFNVSVPATFRQHRAPAVLDPSALGTEVPTKTFDFAAAPEGYLLLNAKVGFSLPIGDHSVAVSLSGENLLNKSYRNYMNRLRYYADDIGSNFILRLSYNFLSH